MCILHKNSNIKAHVGHTQYLHAAAEFHLAHSIPAHQRHIYTKEKRERARHKLPLILFPSLSLLLSHHFPTYFLPSALNPYTHTASFIESLKKLG